MIGKELIIKRLGGPSVNSLGAAINERNDTDNRCLVADKHKFLKFAYPPFLQMDSLTMSGQQYQVWAQSSLPSSGGVRYPILERLSLEPVTIRRRYNSSKKDEIVGANIYEAEISDDALYSISLDRIQEPVKRLFVMARRRVVYDKTHRLSSRYTPMATALARSRDRLVTVVKDAENWDKYNYEHDFFSFVPLVDVAIVASNQIIYSTQMNDPLELQEQDRWTGMIPLKRLDQCYTGANTLDMMSNNAIDDPLL